MATYDVTTYDFDRGSNMIKDGDHHSVEAFSATEAVLSLIRQLAAYEDGTVGHRDYMSLTEVGTEDENLTVTAYGMNDGSWEVHIYIGTVDEAFLFNV